MRSRLLKDTCGVSVIIGAMLLIIIVVTGAVAVAAIVTSLQEEAAEKAGYKATVEREELEILKISLYKEATIDDFEGVYEIVEGRPETGIEYRVRIIDNASKYNWIPSRCGIDLADQRAGAPGNYSLEVAGNGGTIMKTFDESFDPGTVSFWIKSNGDITVRLYRGTDFIVGSNTITNTEGEWKEGDVTSTDKFNKIEFKLSSATTICLDDIKYSNPHYWGECEVTIRNLNIDPCTLKELAIKGAFAKEYSVFTKKGNVWKKETFTSMYPYDIPAQMSAPIRINFLKDFGDPWKIRADQPVSIDVLTITDLGNNFMEVFAPPVPIADVKIETEDIGMAYRDVLILDASESYDLDGFISDYNWSVYYNDSGTFRAHYQQGKKIRANLSGIITGIEPIKIDLEVTDNTGMVAKLSSISGNITIPANQNFNPPARLIVDYSSSTITATVRDTENGLVKGAVVNFFVFYDKYGNLTVDPWSNTTKTDGTASTNYIEGSGTIRVRCGRLPYVDVSVGP